jgi:hypothetical protein
MTVFDLDNVMCPKPGLTAGPSHFASITQWLGSMAASNILLSLRHQERLHFLREYDIPSTEPEFSVQP